MAARLAPAAAQQGRARLRRPVPRCSSLLALLAPLWAEHVANTTPDRNDIADTINDRRQEVDRSSPSTACRSARRGRAVLPRRRRQRPRRHGAPALRRPQLALHRHHRHAHHDVPRRGPRHCSRATSAAGPTRVISRALDVLWAFPVLLLGVALGVALALGGLHIGPISIEATRCWIPTLIIGVVERRLPRAADPRPGAVAAREGVRRGRARPGRGRPADHVRRAAAEPASTTVLVFFPLLSPTRSCSRRRCRSSAPACSRRTRRGAR